MKRFILLTTVLLLLSGMAGIAFADDNKPAAGPDKQHGWNMQPMQWMERAYDELNLTEDQKAKMEQIRKEFTDELKGIQESGLSKKEARKKVMGLSRSMREKTNALLTPEQKEKLSAKRREMRERIRPSGVNIAVITGRLEKSLGLSDKQIKEIEKIAGEGEDKINALRKEKNNDRKALREKINAVHQERAKKITAILTPEQQKKLAAAMREMQENR